jgi:hypothetical protein
MKFVSHLTVRFTFPANGVSGYVLANIAASFTNPLLTDEFANARPI